MVNVNHAMWTTFRYEAKAVYNFMKAEKLLKEAEFRLPGLGLPI
jgi:hypothetical protein